MCWKFEHSTNSLREFVVFGKMCYKLRRSARLRSGLLWSGEFVVFGKICNNLRRSGCLETQIGYNLCMSGWLGTCHGSAVKNANFEYANLDVRSQETLHFTLNTYEHMSTYAHMSACKRIWAHIGIWAHMNMQTCTCTPATALRFKDWTLKFKA